MDIHPCSCAEVSFDVHHRLRTEPDGTLVAVYEGLCRRCGLPRQFTFALDPATPPPPPAFGGAAPSQIICPGQFALVADVEARSAALSPDGLDPRERARNRAFLARAVAAQEEVAKFVPYGADAVPASAFTSPEGRALYARDPGRFDADRLAAVIDEYRALLTRYDARS